MPSNVLPGKSWTPRGRAATTPSTWTCTARWSPNTWTMAKANCWRGSARSWGRTCRWWPAWTCTPTSPRRCCKRPMRWWPFAPIRMWTWRRPANRPRACCWPASRPARAGPGTCAACPSLFPSTVCARCCNPRKACTKRWRGWSRRRGSRRCRSRRVFRRLIFQSAARWCGPTAPMRRPWNTLPTSCIGRCWNLSRSGRLTSWNPPRPCAAHRRWRRAHRAPS
ncbi:hypothetical protein D3C86_672660 [compost metagenome]